ncbi:MAG: hypothetical protein JKY09_04140 [Crocinitomicaceae bacterium]|nr:hypothetical protein [Crocinitomicaceae bacterium]
MNKEKKKEGLLKRYNGADAKKNLKYTGMKTGVDVVVGSSVGAGLGALFGIWSPLAGLLMIGSGHYLGDKSGVLRVAGAATIAYGIAKAVENRESANEAVVNGISLGAVKEGAKDRLTEFKTNWLKAFFLDKLIGKKEQQENKEELAIGAIDLSSLDVFDDINKQQAMKFELDRIQNEDEDQFLIESDDDDFDEFESFDESDDLEGTSYDMIGSEQIDFSTL